ncbi:MAG TPA: twin-arginine translocase TatA/TatE family subunit [bacterium]|nr:twin-arginine translocase TatA/TatE family subunit [bacterium]
MGSIGTYELLLILLVFLLLFGSRELPSLAKKFGKAVSRFQNATRDVKDEINRFMDDDDESRYLG